MHLDPKFIKEILSLLTDICSDPYVIFKSNQITWHNKENYTWRLVGKKNNNFVDIDIYYLGQGFPQLVIRTHWCHSWKEAFETIANKIGDEAAASYNHIINTSMKWQAENQKQLALAGHSD